MRRSEIFDEFVKIAQEKGIIKLSYNQDSSKGTIPHNWDARTISDIAALYGVKPDMPKDMEYERNIMEVAHPNSVVISPSYDKLNGLVENNIERQNILLHIMYKEPDSGSTNQKKYPLKPWMTNPFSSNPNVAAKTAEKELMLSLVRIGNNMDNKDQDQLRILADTCLTQIHSGFQKKAILPLLIGAATVLSLIYLQQHLDSDDGLNEDYTRLQSELSDFMSANTTLGFGHTYDAQLKEDISKLQTKLGSFWDTYEKVLPLVRNLEKPRDAQETLQLAESKQTQQTMQAYETLRTEAADLFTYLNATLRNFNSLDYKDEHTQKGAITSVLDKIPFMHGGKASLTADDFDDVVNAIPPFITAIKRFLDILAHADDVKKQALNDLASAKSQLVQDAFTAPTATPQNPENKTVKDVDQEASGLDNMWESMKDLMPEMPKM